MPSSVHAQKGASSASRWIACPGSVREIASLPEPEQDGGSIYAKEGTAAHFLAETCLIKGHDPLEYDQLWISDFGVITDSADQPDDPGTWFQITDEMVDAVQLYVDTVSEYRKRFKVCDVMYEQIVFPVPGREDDMYGTADCIIHQPGGELIVIDFKYGKGLVVEVDYNDQIMYYGLGAMRAVGGPDDLEKVTLVVVQPRARHEEGPVRTWETAPEDLARFEGTLEAAANQADRPNAPLNPGKHCREYFCPAAPRCPALTAEIVAQVPDDLDDVEEPSAHVRLPDPNDPEELSKALKVASLAEFWAREVVAMAIAAAEGGTRIPGFKLVRGRSQRRWKDEADVERRLKNKAGVSVNDIYKKTLQTPAQLEKNPKIGKKWVEKLVVKPPGKTTIAPVSDPREAVQPTIAAVSVIEDDSDLE